MEEEVLTCTPENVQAFNQRMRSQLPGAHALAKALHAHGLMDGLRGARIAPLGALPGGVVPVASAEVEKREADRKWRAGQ